MDEAESKGNPESFDQDPGDLAATPDWAAIRIEMLDSSDNKAAYRVFGPLEGYVVRFKVKDQPLRDVKIIEVGATQEQVDADDEPVEGFLVQECDVNGDEMADKEHELFDYSVVEAIGVY